jgi:hypothetical protein
MNYEHFTAQFDFGRDLSLVWGVVGVAIVPLSTALAVLALQKRRTIRTRMALAIIAVILVSVWTLVLVFQFREPVIDDTDAAMMVESLPEVQSFIASAAPAGPPRNVIYLDTPTAPSSRDFLYVSEFGVGETLPDGRPARPFWAKFRVNLVSRRIDVLPEGSHTWIPLRAWREGLKQGGPSPDSHGRPSG